MVTKVAELLDDVCAVYRPRLQAAKIEVEKKYEIAGEVTIYPSELRQVFTNLFTNAIDAIGQRGRMSLTIERAGETQVVVKVRDTGCGIPPENLHSIFEPFFTTKGEQGTGIGLWVIKGIVDKLGGKIEVQSRPPAKPEPASAFFFPPPKSTALVRERRALPRRSRPTHRKPARSSQALIRHACGRFSPPVLLDVCSRSALESKRAICCIGRRLSLFWGTS